MGPGTSPGRQLKYLAYVKPPVSAPILTSILLLVASNVFMTFAWYAH
ncbi:MAG: DMT family protein, partial [Betaproteobacteria bacterium]|nr:DMT family protein [Betaproteobacteria bacterium]